MLRHSTFVSSSFPTFCIVALVATMGSSCGGPAPGISGKLDGAANAEVRLAAFRDRGFEDVSTHQADGSGGFVIPPDALTGLALDVYKVNVGESHFFLIGDSLTQLQVQGALPEANGLITDLAISGDDWTKGFAAFISEIYARNDSMAAAKAVVSGQGTPEEQIAGKQQYDGLRDRLTSFVRRTIREHKKDPIGLMALEHLDLSADRILAQQVIDSTRALMGHSMAHRNLSRRVASQPKPRQTARRNDLIEPGMAMPDIALNDPTGKEIALSDLRGKVVLVDFWASWCGPCRRENPNVVRAWQAYKDKGFEVFSISLDKDVAKWERAIAQDGLLWPNHVSDLKGWNSVAASRYGISSIPHAILIDKDGTVVATHLRGSQLEAQLEQLL